MSRATRQSLALLATISGTMAVLESLEKEENAIHFRFMKPHIKKTRKRSDNAVYKWNCTGDEMKNTRWIVNHIESWDRHLVESRAKLTPLVLVNMSLQCLTDLYEKVRDPRKKELLEPIFEPLQKVSDYLDPHGDKYEDYEYTENLLKILYQKTGFHV